MLQLLLIGASLPLFAVIGWALLSPDQATDVMRSKECAGDHVHLHD